MNTYKIEVTFKENDERVGQDLKVQLTLELHHDVSDGKMFVIEFFRELAYSDVGDKLMLKCSSVAGDGLAFFDYYTLANAFGFKDAKELAKFFYETYEIQSINYLDKHILN